MTVRTPPSFLQNITLVANGHTAQNDRLTQGALWAPSAAALGNRSGIVPAAAGGQAEVTMVNNTTVRVQAFRAEIQGSRSALQGQYTVINDSAVDLAVGPQASGVTRKDLLIVNVCDSAFSPDTLDTARVLVVAGTPAASNPVAPTLGGANLGNYLILGTINVPATGGTTTFTPAVNLSTVAAGGVLPIGSGDTDSGVYVGQYRDHPTRGLERWDGTRWRTWGQATLGALLTWTASAVMPGSTLWGPGPVTSAVQAPGNGGLVIGAAGSSDRFLVPAAGTYLVTHRMQVTTGGVSFGPRSFMDIVSDETYRYAVGGPAEGIATMTGIAIVANPTTPIQIVYYFSLTGSTSTAHFGSTRVTRIGDYV